MKKLVLKYYSRGPEGNIFWILGQVRRLLREQNRITAYNELCCIYERDLFTDQLQRIVVAVRALHTLP